VTFHEVFELTDTVTLFCADDGTAHCEMPVDNVGATPGWVTATVRDSTGYPVVFVTVTVAVRDVVVVLAAAFIVTAEVFDPVEAENVTHESLDDTFHDWFEVISNVCIAAAEEGTVQTVLSSVSVAAGGWVTVTVRVTFGYPAVVVNVAVAVRDDAVVFSSAVRVTDASPAPDAEDRVNHDWLDEPDHATVDFTATA